MNSVDARERELLESTADRYQRAGYTVTIQPSPTTIPFSLGGFTPDLLASNDRESLLIEVKEKAEQMSFDQLRSISVEVAQHPAWRFLLVTQDDVIEPGPPTEQSATLVQKRVEEAATLADGQHTEAAFLTLWIALESLLRDHSRKNALPVDRLTFPMLIAQLYSQGELGMEDFEQAKELQSVRNRVVHGFEVQGLPQRLLQLERLVHSILDQWALAAA